MYFNRSCLHSVVLVFLANPSVGSMSSVSSHYTIIGQHIIDSTIYTHARVNDHWAADMYSCLVCDIYPDCV